MVAVVVGCRTPFSAYGELAALALRVFDHPVCMNSMETSAGNTGGQSQSGLVPRSTLSAPPFLAGVAQLRTSFGITSTSGAMGFCRRLQVTQGMVDVERLVQMLDADAGSPTLVRPAQDPRMRMEPWRQPLGVIHEKLRLFQESPLGSAWAIVLPAGTAADDSRTSSRFRPRSDSSRTGGATRWRTRRGLLQAQGLN